MTLRCIGIFAYLRLDLWRMAVGCRWVKLKKTLFERCKRRCAMMGGFGLFGSWMMILGLLIPIVLVGLLALGGVALFNGMGGSWSAPAQRACPKCTRSVQNDWHHCPFCGENL